jgi:2,3-bisphosphoglycerate-dependent phosphoglycerate mutase
MANNGHPNLKSDYHNYLTKKGVDQAIELGEKLNLEGFKPDVVWSSTLPRAYQTTMIILSSLDEPSEIGLSDRIVEMSWFPNDMFLTEEECNRRFGVDHYDQIHADINKKPHPEGETQLDVYNRVVPFIEEKIIDLINSDKDILMVCHYYVIRAVLSYLEHGSPENMLGYDPRNCEPFIITR